MLTSKGVVKLFPGNNRKLAPLTEVFDDWLMNIFHDEMRIHSFKPAFTHLFATFSLTGASSGYLLVTLRVIIDKEWLQVCSQSEQAEG